MDNRQMMKQEKDMYALRREREELILKLISNLHRGTINNLLFKKDSQGEPRIYEIVYSNESYYPPIKKRNIPITDDNLTHLRDLMIRNIHDIASKLNPEYLDILEFLLEKIERSWNWETIDEIKKDIEEIKKRCCNILMLLVIEED